MYDSKENVSSFPTGVSCQVPAESVQFGRTQSLIVVCFCKVTGTALLCSCEVVPVLNVRKMEKPFI